MKTKNYLYLLVFVVFAASCTTSRKAIYFNNIADTSFNRTNYKVDEPIQNNDLLSITVSSLNPEASIIFNNPNVSGQGVTNTNAAAINTSGVTGYLVSKQGTIKFPVLGTLEVAGLTNKQLEDSITAILLKRELLLDPIVSVRIINFKVTVLGEVAKPTVITVPNEKISVLEALGMAGDLTIFAKRDNVLLIREEGSKKTIKRLDLNSKEILSSPYYYLKTNDVIYAEPNKAKVASSSNTRQLLPTILAALSFISIILTRTF